MKQQRKNLKKERRSIEGRKETKNSSPKHLAEKGKELKKRIEALLQKIDQVLKEYKTGFDHKVIPHVHLCDGTKIDIRRFIR